MHADVSYFVCTQARITAGEKQNSLPVQVGIQYIGGFKANNFKETTSIKWYFAIRVLFDFSKVPNNQIGSFVFVSDCTRF